MPLDHDSANEYNSEHEVGIGRIEFGFFLNNLLLFINKLVSSLFDLDLILSVGLLSGISIVIRTCLHYYK